MPGVRIYPYKEVESGAQIHENLIWESRARSRLFGADGVEGLVNVDLTPEIAVRVGAALGTALKRGARVVASREGAAGLPARQAGDDLRADLDRRRRGRPARDPAPVARHLMKTEGYDAGVHVGVGRVDPELVQVRFFEHPGIQLTLGAAEGDREALHAPGAAPRLGGRRGRDHVPGARDRGVLAGAARHARRRGDPASQLPRRRRLRLLGGVLRAPARARPARRRGGLGARVRDRPQRQRRAARARRPDEEPRRARSAPTSASSSTAPPSALYLIDERGREIPVEQALLLFLRLIAARRPRGQARVPGHRDEPGRPDGRGQRPRGRPHARLARRPDRTAAEEGVVFAGAVGGGYVFPRVHPGLRRGREPLQAARAARADRAAALGARRGPAVADARAPPDHLPVGAQGLRHARAHRAPEGPRRRPHGRDQGLRRARLGAGARPTRTSRSSTSTPRAANAGESAAARGRAALADRGGICRRRARPARPIPSS